MHMCFFPPISVSLKISFANHSSLRRIPACFPRGHKDTQTVAPRCLGALQPWWVGTEDGGLPGSGPCVAQTVTGSPGSTTVGVDLQPLSLCHEEQYHPQAQSACVASSRYVMSVYPCCL